MASSATHRGVRLRRGFAAALALAALAVFAHGLWHTSWVLLYPDLVLHRGGIWLLAGTLTALGAAALVFPPRVGLAMCAAVYAAGAGFWLAPGVVQGQKRGTEVHLRAHAYHGAIGEPNSESRHTHEDFDVIYTFDETGFRLTPAPAAPRGEVLILGCSFAFGIGVDDSETFASQLATRHWTDVRVVNRAFSMWSTTDAYLELHDYLADHHPLAVIYGYSDIHIGRNYLRKSWHGKKGPAARIPKFTIRDGHAVFLGMVDVSEATLPEGGETFDFEYRLTIALTRDMQEMCRKAQVPFYVVEFNSPITNWEYDPAIQGIREAGVKVFDLRRVSNAFHTHDGHPRAEWHAALADAMAALPELTFLRPAAAGASGGL